MSILSGIIPELSILFFIVLVLISIVIIFRK